MVKILNIVRKALHILFHPFSKFLITQVAYQSNGSRQMSFLFSKEGSKDDIKNYGFISLTCLVMKLFERIFKEELLGLRTSHSQYSRQYGFFNLKSCSTNLVNLTDKLVVSSINETQSLSTDVDYFDFPKAFDQLTTGIRIFGQPGPGLNISAGTGIFLQIQSWPELTYFGRDRDFQFFVFNFDFMYLNSNVTLELI